LRHASAGSACALDGTNWKLSVTDNGIGRPDGVFAQAKTGLGTSIVKALAHQLGAQVETSASPTGTTVSVTRATFSAKIRAAYRVASLPSSTERLRVHGMNSEMRVSAQETAGPAASAVGELWQGRETGADDRENQPGGGDDRNDPLPVNFFIVFLQFGKQKKQKGKRLAAAGSD